MLTNSHFEQIRTTRGVIAHVTDEGSTRIPLNTILAILDFILLGLKEIFFDKMGKPKNKLQLILSIPSIIKFAVEVINRVTKDIHRPARVKGISNEQKVVEAIDKATRRVSLKEGGIAHGPTFGGQPDSAEFIAPISGLKKHFPEIDKATRRVSLKEGGIVCGPSAGNPPGKDEFIQPIADLKKHFPEIDKAVKRNKDA